MSELKHNVVAKRWAMLIKEYMESGMLVREWCHDRNIKESQYYYWLRILCRKREENTEQFTWLMQGLAVEQKRRI